MATRATDDVVHSLVRYCVTASTPDDLMNTALPALLECSGATAVLALRRTPEAWVRDAAAGPDLDPAQLGSTLDALDREELPVPDEWARGAGIARVTAQRAGRGTTVLVTCWSDAQPSSDQARAYSAALDLVVTSLDRLAVEAELADLIARVDNAQQLANMGDYDWHIATDTNRWSDQLYRIYGHEPQSFNASYERFLSQIHPDDRDRITAIHQHAYGTGEPYQMIERIVRPDGSVRYLSSNGQVIRDPAGTPVRMRGTCIDVTDRVLAEQERQVSADRFRSLVESAPEAILVVNADGDVVQANGRATDLLGGDPIGHPIATFVPGPLADGQAVAAKSTTGTALQLDITTARLSGIESNELMAVFLDDATPRLASESTAATLREVQVRRRQALEINDNVVQSLTVAVSHLHSGNTPATAEYLSRTMDAARRMMNDWLDPVDGQQLEPGDLVRKTAAGADGAGEVEQTADEQGADGTAQLRVMLVDDYYPVRDLLRTQLELSGSYEVVGEAGDGKEAVRLAELTQPDVVVLDLAMPVMDGLQALPLILQAVPGVRVIVLSGFDHSTMEPRVLAAGAARYVEKGATMYLPALIEEVVSAA